MYNERKEKEEIIQKQIAFFAKEKEMIQFHLAFWLDCQRRDKCMIIFCTLTPSLTRSLIRIHENKQNPVLFKRERHRHGSIPFLCRARLLLRHASGLAMDNEQPDVKMSVVVAFHLTDVRRQMVAVVASSTMERNQAYSKPMTTMLDQRNPISIHSKPMEPLRTDNQHRLRKNLVLLPVGRPGTGS